MQSAPDKKSMIFAPAAGFLAGMVFTLVFGDLDPIRFVVEELTMGPVELPFIILAALVTERYGWRAGLFFAGFGVLGSWAINPTTSSATVPVFTRNALTGFFIGARGFSSDRFSFRFAAAAAPGVLLAVMYGFPIVLGGVPAETLETIRKEAESMYVSFMSADDARNASENAIFVVKAVFGAGFAVFFLNSVILTWIAFIATAWTQRKLKREPEAVPPFRDFRLPFHVIWVFLVSFGLVLFGREPIYPVALNVCLAAAGLYGFQGTAIVVHHMSRSSIGRIPRILFWLMFFITIGFSSFFLAFLGMIDNWYSLRPQVKKPEPGGEREDSDHEGDS